MNDRAKLIVEAVSLPARKLDMRLTNESAKPITVSRHSLPWVGAYSILLVAVKADAVGTVLDRSTPVDDPLIGTTTLQPGETLNGEIDLDRRFPGLPEAINSRDVIVFWSHQLEVVDGDPLPRTGGWVRLPKH